MDKRGLFHIPNFAVLRPETQIWQKAISLEAPSTAHNCLWPYHVLWSWLSSACHRWRILYRALSSLLGFHSSWLSHKTPVLKNLSIGVKGQDLTHLTFQFKVWPNVPQLFCGLAMNCENLKVLNRGFSICGQHW